MNKIPKRKRIRVLSFMLVLALCFSTQFTFETHAEDLRKKQKDLEKDLSDMNQNKAKLGDELSAKAKALTNLVREIDQTRQELDLAKAREIGQYEMMKKRIQYMYEASSGNFFTSLLESKSMTDLLNRAEFFSTVSQYDREMLEKLQTIHKDIKEKENDLLTKQREMEKQQTQLTENYNQLISMISSTSSKIEDYKAQIAAAEEAKKAAEEAKKENENSMNSNDSSDSNENTEKPSKPEEKPSKPEEEPSKPEEKPSKPQKPSSNTELALFAAILECEAGSTNYDGLLAVATVIMNRKESPKYPNTITGVIYQKGQFSPTWSGKLDKVLQRGAKPLCYTVAKDALNGKRHSAVKNCYQFRASWTGHSGTVIGGNVFF